MSRGVYIIDVDIDRGPILQKKCAGVVSGIDVALFKSIFLDTERVSHDSKFIQDLKKFKGAEFNKFMDRSISQFLPLDNMLLAISHIKSSRQDFELTEKYGQYVASKGIPVIAFSGGGLSEKISSHGSYYYFPTPPEEMNLAAFLKEWGKTDFNPSLVRDYWYLLKHSDTESAGIDHISSLDILIQGYLAVREWEDKSQLEEEKRITGIQNLFRPFGKDKGAYWFDECLNDVNKKLYGELIKENQKLEECIHLKKLWRIIRGECLNKKNGITLEEIELNLESLLRIFIESNNEFRSLFKDSSKVENVGYVSVGSNTLLGIEGESIVSAVLKTISTLTGISTQIINVEQITKQLKINTQSILIMTESQIRYLHILRLHGFAGGVVILSLNPFEELLSKYAILSGGQGSHYACRHPLLLSDLLQTIEKIVPLEPENLGIILDELLTPKKIYKKEIAPCIYRLQQEKCNLKREITNLTIILETLWSITKRALHLVVEINGYERDKISNLFIRIIDDLSKTSDFTTRLDLVDVLDKLFKKWHDSCVVSGEII